MKARTICVLVILLVNASIVESAHKARVLTPNYVPVVGNESQWQRLRPQVDALLACKPSLIKIFSEDNLDRFLVLLFVLRQGVDKGSDECGYGLLRAGFFRLANQYKAIKIAQYLRGAVSHIA